VIVKLQTRLFVLFSLSALIIMLVLGTALYSRLWKERLELVRMDISNELHHIDFILNAFFTEVENDIETLAQNETVRSADDRGFTRFLDADESTFTYNIGEREQRIIDIFNDYRSSHHYVSSVYMGRENGGFVRSHKRERPTPYDPRERPWYLIARNSPGRAVKTEAYPALTTSDINIGIVRALVDRKGVFFGVVGADVTLKDLTGYITGIETNPPGEIVLVDGNGVVLAGLGGDALFRNVREYSSDLAGILSGPGPHFVPAVIRGVKQYVSSIPSSGLGWKIAILIPSADIEKQITGRVATAVAGMAAALVLLSVLTMIGLRVYVVNPLGKFIDETNYIARTFDLKRRIDIDSRDEIGLLANSYNQMMNTLDMTYQSLKKTEADLIAHKDHLEELVEERTARLQEANENLSGEVKRHVQTLNELAIAKDRAETADRLKSAFLATMSHELRTPLNSIIGFTGILLQGMVGTLNDEQRKQLGMVRGSAQHLLSLITDVLDISKIEAGQLKVLHEPFDLVQTVEKAVDSARPLAEKKGLELACILSPGVGAMTGDRRRVEQILLNLISNAVKFTEKGSITITCGPEEKGVAVRVTDTGIGIRPEDLGLIFKPFQQIDSGMTRKYEGTGLGLSISRRLVELMGGRIWVTSVPGSGSTFGFYLPEGREDA
jgi:signal transduction histidine kinase